MRQNPQIYHYLKKFQDDPTSRVFAPLAESYRKAGLLEEAVEIAREGLKIHPHFIGGRVALARALFDQKKYPEVIEELRAVIENVPDNLIAQRLYGESCLMLDRVADALGAFKMLLFYSPQDADVAGLVEELESQAYREGALVIRTDSTLREPAEIGSLHGKGSSRSWVEQIELLQKMLQKVERYRLQTSVSGDVR